MNRPLFFDEVQIGEHWTSPARTVTEADVVNFAGATGDFNPLHVDHEFARQSPFGRPIAHGLLGLAWTSGLARFTPWMQTVALVRLAEWSFAQPIFIGDTVHVETEVLAKSNPARRRGQITWKRQLINQSGEIVQTGIVETLVAVGSDGDSRSKPGSSPRRRSPRP